MCGRYTLTRPGDALVELDAVDTALAAEVRERLLRPRYNVAPGQRVLTVRRDEQGRRTAAAPEWGLGPPWSRSRPERPPINARVETVAERPSFRDALRRRRCLVPADGFYEWRRRQRGPKAPTWFHLEGRPIVTFAGLWERWRDPQSGDEVETVCIVTGPAASEVAAVHDRMPVVVPGELRPSWLDPELRDEDALRSALAALTPPPWRGRPVSSRVNRVENDDPDCLEETAPPPENLSLF